MNSFVADFIKRMFDVFFAVLGILIFFIPFLLIAMLVKLGSPGPIFFLQSRVGRHQKIFSIIKFRTMYCARLEGAPSVTATSDPRITKVGRFLRNSKLDEIPQLINILLGQMSFVGPRPEVEKYVKHYPALVRAKVFSVKPGLTDMASLVFRNEEEILDKEQDVEQAYIEKVLPIKIQYYLNYIERQSFLYDFKIVLMTVIHIVFRREVKVEK